MTSSIAWQMHGCYALGSSQYYQMPLDAARNGCKDDTVSYDHRDPSHPVRNIVKHMHYLREQYPVLNDGWYLQQLSNQTHQVLLPGSSGKPTETGIWSVIRKEFIGSQTLANNQSVWLVYHNENTTISYTFDCTDPKKSFLSAFDKDTTAKNLFYPYDEVTLGSTSGVDTGCLNSITMKPYEFKAYVPKEKFVSAPPMITRFSPGHDARVKSKVAAGQQETIQVEIQFSSFMSCDSVTASIMINSTTEDLRIAQVKNGSVQCSTMNSSVTPYVAGLPSAWSWKATLENVSNGIHAISVRNATTSDGRATNSVDRFMFRTGQEDNPMVFPQTANYTRALIHTNGSSKDLYISQKAAGADKWRYSLNWGSSWSDWQDYHGGNNTLHEQPWSGTKLQKWDDTHIMAQYWSKLSGSSSVIQHADVARLDDPPRRFPHLFAQGPYNQYGFDAGLNNEVRLQENGAWEWHFMSEWPDTVQLNVWGMNPDGQPDATFVYGDINNDGVLDRLPPSSLSKLAVNVTVPPPSPYLAWKLSVDDGTFRYQLLPVGNRWQQLALFLLLALIPLCTAILAVWSYMQGFYEVKFNEVGVSEKHGFMALPLAFRRGRGMKKLSQNMSDDNLTALDAAIPFSTPVVGVSEKRRTVLIATLEYDIDDWNIKIKIGGLGVMAQLMGKNLEHQSDFLSTCIVSTS
jgi:alpha-1,3-glucan synthase